jgi:TonB-linked SusC/RagA family outer membrane protein
MQLNQIIRKVSNKLLLCCCFLWVLAMVASTQTALAQATKIQGVVLSKEGPVPGATIMVEGTTRGVVSDSDGKYSIEAKAGEVLVFSFIGFATQKVTVGAKTQINVTLGFDEKSLDEIVVVGYGQTQNNRTMSTAISKVTSKSIEALPVYRTEQALQGTAPGVIVLQESGSPGAPLTVRIRGVSSSSNASPLYLVDGMQVPNMDFLNSSDIANMSVLKDAASSAIYGARGGNGVVLVQTKTGSRGLKKPKISVSGYYGVQSLFNKPDLMDKDQFISFYNNSVDYYNEHGLSGSIPARGKFTAAEAAALPNTDWYDAVFEETPISNFFANIVDGGNDYSYSISAGLYKQDGMVGGNVGKSNFQRKSVRGSFEKDLFKGFNISINGTLAQTDRNYLRENTSETGFGIMNYLNSLPPIYPVFAANGEIFNPGRQSPVPNYNGIDLPVVGAVSNPMLGLQLTNQNAVNDVVSTGVAASYKIANFKVATNFSYYSFNLSDRSFIPTYDFPEQTFTNIAATLTESQTKFWRTQWENTVTYDLSSSKDHKLQALAGMSIIRDESRVSSMQGVGFFVNSLAEANFSLMDDPSQIVVTPVNINETAWLSFFGRVNYSFKEKYLFSATLRSDASSKFGTNNRTGYFPSFSAGWNISEEPFLKGFKSLNLLKLRASWGVNGNDQIANYQYTSQITTSAQYILNGSQTVGIAPVTLANPDIRWERVAQTNFGLDMNLFNNRLGITFDYYVKKTTDMLAPTGTPILVGQTAPFKNVADVENQGIELLINHKNRVNKNFSYNVQVNFATSRNKVTALGEGQPIASAFVQPSWQQPISRTDVGHPIASFYGYVTDGLDDTGNLKFKDLNGDGTVDDNDQTFIGNPYPDLVYGVTAGIEYKGFDFSFFMLGNQGQDIYKAYIRPDAVNVNKPASFANAWTSSNQNTNVARSNLFGNNNGHDQISDYYIEDGSFLRLKTITLGYTLPKRISNYLKASKIRVYVTAQNLFMLTNYSGIDPEIGQSSAASFLDVGIDRGFYPQPRTILGGFQISLF